MPIAAVEIEVSLQAYEQQTREGGHWQIPLFTPGSLSRIPGFSDCYLCRTWHRYCRIFVRRASVSIVTSSSPATALLVMVYSLAKSRTV